EARYLGRIDDTHLHQVAVLAGLGVEAKVVLAFDHLIDDDRRLVARVGDDLARRLLEGTQHDLDPGVLIGALALQILDVGASPQIRNTTAGDDAFFDGRTGRVQRVFDAGFLFFHFHFSRRADLDQGHAAGELGHTLLQLFLVVIRRRILDLLANVLHTRFDRGLFAGAVDDRRVILADLDALRTAQVLQLRVFEFESEFFRDHRAPGENRNVFEHGFAAIAKP